MRFGNVARGAIGLTTGTAGVVVLQVWTEMPYSLALIIAGIIGVLAMCSDLLWVAICVWFWPSRLRRTD